MTITATLYHEPAAAAAGALHAGVADFALLRMATLPYRVLDGLRLPATESHLARLFAAEAAMEAMRQTLEDALFARVSELPEDARAARREVLQLRREVHAGAASRLKPVQLDALTAGLAPGTAAALAAWRAAAAERSGALEAAGLAFAAELQEKVRPALRAPLAEPLYRGALAMASTGVALEAGRERRLPTRNEPDNLERSLFGYLVRAAAKTSPFSTFMASSAVPVEPVTPAPAPSVEDRRMERRVRLNRGMVARLARAAVRAAIADGEVALRLNPTLAPLGGARYRALCERELVLLGRPWREQRRTQFQLHPAVAKTLAAAPRAATWNEWLALLVKGGIEEEQAGPLLEKLFERGVFQVPLLADAFDPRPEAALLDFVATSGAAALRRVAAPLAQMDALCRQLADDDSAGRAGAVEQIRALEGQILADLPGGVAEPFHNVVLEDCWTDGVQGKLGAGLLAPVAELQAFLATQMEVSPQYLRLVGYFVQEYGEGGVCADLLDFLMRHGDRLVDSPEYGGTLSEGPGRPPAPGARMGVTAQVDVALADGRPLMVVNKVYDGGAWLSARYAFGESAGTVFLRDSMRRWLERTCAPCEPVDLVVNGDCNDLQAHPRLTRRVLQWHGEPVQGPEEGILRPDALRLRHDRSTGLLALEDDAGVPISLVYLGATFPTPSWGIPFALSILTQPYRLKRPDFRPPARADAGDVNHTPRLQQGDLVLSRAVWWVRSDYLLREWFATEGVERLLKVERERRAHGLPALLFAHAAAPQGLPGAVPVDVLSSDRKPIWIDTRAPFCLSMLQRLAKRNTWIALTEMLPAPEDHWLRVNGEKHVCEIQLELSITPGDARRE